MIRYILNRTIWKKWDKESQDALYKLVDKRDLIFWLCSFVWVILYTFSQIPCFVVLFAQKGLKTGVFVTLICYTTISSGIFVFACAKFIRPMCIFADQLAKRFYFLIYTRKGEALGAEDFKKIQKEKPKASYFIETGECRGYCYFICFDICKILGKGSVEFVAIKMFSPHEEKESYTMHALYVYRGWAFDTYSARQFPLEEIHEIYDAKVYKTFSAEEIADKTYEQFKAENSAEAKAWAAKNDCCIDFG